MIAAGLADRIDDAHHHIVHLRGVELVALLDALEHLGREIERRHFVQRAVGLAAPARGPDMVINEGLGHGVLRYKLRAITSFMISLVPA